MMTEISFSTIVGIFICVGIVVTYIPQFHKIISTKSSRGISHYSLFIGVTAACASFFNACTFHSDIMFECETFTNCSEQLLGFYQITIQFMCVCLFYLLIVWYIPNPSIIMSEFSSQYLIPFYKKKEIIMYACANVIIIMIAAVSLGLIFGTECDPDSGRFQHCIMWAKILGYYSLGMVFIQYVPQIYEVYQKKTCGSLSIAMLIMQVIGNACWVAYLWKNSGAHFTTWLPYLATTFFQFSLTIFCLYYEIRQRRAGRIYQTIYDDVNSDNSYEEERRPLVINN
jgi:uncharacterized protein with PQ loop repeat